MARAVVIDPLLAAGQGEADGMGQSAGTSSAEQPGTPAQEASMELQKPRQEAVASRNTIGACTGMPEAANDASSSAPGSSQRAAQLHDAAGDAESGSPLQGGRHDGSATESSQARPAWVHACQCLVASVLLWGVVATGSRSRKPK